MPKLSLRDLFAVVTIVALALGWWVDRSRLANELRRLNATGADTFYFKEIMTMAAPHDQKRHSE